MSDITRETIKAQIESITSQEDDDTVREIVQNIDQYTKQQEIKAINDFHRNIVEHFEIIPKIQDKVSMTTTSFFNPANYQAVACKYIAELSKELKEVL